MSIAASRAAAPLTATMPVSSPNSPILFNEGWHRIYTDGIQKLTVILASLAHTHTHAHTGRGDDSDGDRDRRLSFSNSEYIELYTLIYQMCIQKSPHCYTPQLYDKYDQCITDYLSQHVLPSLSSPQSQSSSLSFLSAVTRAWSNHQIMKKWMLNFFRYLDRFYVKRHAKKSLNDVAIQRFRTIVFDAVKGRLTKCLLEVIELDRVGESVDRGLLHDGVQLYIEMGATAAASQSSPTNANNQPVVRTINTSTNNGTGTNNGAVSFVSPALRVYVNDFEKPFINATTDFYSRESARWLLSSSCPEYLRLVDDVLVKEKQRLNDYLHSGSETALFQSLYDVLLLANQSAILDKPNTGFKAMLEKYSYDDLARVYHLYSNVPQSMASIAKIMQMHVMQQGQTLIEKYNNNTNSNSAASNPLSVSNELIESLMALHETFFALIQNEFAAHSAFQRALRESFETVVNQPLTLTLTQSQSQSMAELLSNYIDSLLKKGSTIKIANERELHSQLEKLIRLFTYLGDKDLFNEFYKKLLASRLLLNKSASIEAEKFLIGQLKLKCGHSFTNKLEGMINEIETNAEILGREWRSYLATNKITFANHLDFTVQTLSTGYWPSYPVDDLRLPLSLQRCIEAYQSFYDSRTNHRRLKWIHELGQVTMTAHYPKRKVDLIVSTVQAVILMQFNLTDADAYTGSDSGNSTSSGSGNAVAGNPGLTIRQLLQQTGLEAEVLKSQLKSLVNGKYRLLTKSPVERYTDNDVIAPNLSFVQTLRSIRIPNASRKLNKSDRDNSVRAVDEDRRHAMEANIVRIMKARKTLTHSQLIAEVSKQLMNLFQPEPRQIKQRIEDLIAREFLERDSEQSNVYHYLA